MQTATYTKLRSGAWGIRVPGEFASAGESVTVHKRDGGTKTETIGRVLWTGNGISLCTISGRGMRYRGRSYGGGGRRCRECGGYNPYGDPCGEPCD